MRFAILSIDSICIDKMLREGKKRKFIEAKGVVGYNMGKLLKQCCFEEEHESRGEK